MAGWLGGKYGHYGLHEMVTTHFTQLWTKFKQQGATIELIKELNQLNRIYEPFINCACNYNNECYN